MSFFFISALHFGFNIFFLKVWWQAATLFYLFYSEHTYNIYICNSMRTAASCLHRFRSVEGLLWGAEPRFELRPALQQADALLFAPRRTLFAPRRTLFAPRRTLKVALACVMTLSRGRILCCSNKGAVCSKCCAPDICRMAFFCCLKRMFMLP